jgi:Ala-tRNA(Pro) deacylase
MDSADPQSRASAVGSEAVLATIGREVSVPLSMLREFLDRNRIQYLVISHSVAYTAQGIAALTHIPGKELAKTVMVMVDGRLSMAVVPASFRVDLYRLKKYLGVDSVELASESEFRGRFPDCETGSMPPFGNLYGMDVFADEALAEDKEIAFNAGSHRELVRMKFADFFELVKPALIPLTAAKVHRHAA